MPIADLFDSDAASSVEMIGPRALVLREFALPRAAELLRAIEEVVRIAPFRHWVTPGGFTMSIAMTNCGALGWISDRGGYRYEPTDPLTQRHWPAMPVCFLNLARDAAASAGFNDFQPDACLVNRYEPGGKLSLHQDKDELDFDAPIVSVSLGMSATFLFGGLARSDKTARIPLHHADVVVWGGPDRLRFHGVLPIKSNAHPVLGRQRFNLTFRKAA